jgi:hypothetical protein
MLPVNLQKMLKNSMYVHKYNTRSVLKASLKLNIVELKQDLWQ